MNRRDRVFFEAARPGKVCSVWAWLVVLALAGWVVWAVPGCAQRSSAEADSASAQTPNTAQTPDAESDTPACGKVRAAESHAPAGAETPAGESDARACDEIPAAESDTPARGEAAVFEDDIQFFPVVQASAEAPIEDEAETAEQDEDAAAAEEPDEGDAEAELQRQMEEAMRAYEERLKAEAEARAKDPAWQPSHEQVAVIEVAEEGESRGLKNYCLGPDGNLLACWGTGGVQMVRNEETNTWEMKPIEGASEIRIISPEGEQLGKWELDFQPEAICVHTDGTIFVGGQGHLARLNSQGRVLATADSPAVAEAPAAEMAEADAPEGEESEPAEEEEGEDVPAEEPAETRSVVDALLSALGMGSSNNELAEPAMSPEDEAMMRAYQRRRLLTITGLAVSDQDLFVACPMREGYGYGVWRMDHDFQDAKLIVENLRGCCGQMDIQSHDGSLWVPENARHQVTCYDREGNVLCQFGRRDRKAADGFGGCCEPKNLRFLPDGTLYAAESGPPVAIKRFTPEGEFLGVVGLPVFKTGCVRVTVEVAPDGRVYILSPNEAKIYVLAPKNPNEEEAS